jgi:pyruvate,orthophosphate dikinase
LADEDELSILQTARLKGRLSPDVAAVACGVDVDAATATMSSLADAGYLKGEPAVRLTPEGRQRLTELVDAERAQVDHDALTGLYEEFDRHNTDFKQIVTDWQVKDGNPNEHTDEAYDRSIIERLAALDADFQPLAGRIVGVAPRLRNYPQRFSTALERVRAGDTSYVARPITDSYHTVWFEFHEELIGLLGLSREEEAGAGRAV